MVGQVPLAQAPTGLPSGAGLQVLVCKAVSGSASHLRCSLGRHRMGCCGTQPDIPAGNETLKGDGGFARALGFPEGNPGALQSEFKRSELGLRCQQHS